MTSAARGARRHPNSGFLRRVRAKPFPVVANPVHERYVRSPAQVPLRTPGRDQTTRREVATSSVPMHDRHPLPGGCHHRLGDLGDSGELLGDEVVDRSRFACFEGGSLTLGEVTDIEKLTPLPAPVSKLDGFPAQHGPAEPGKYCLMAHARSVGNAEPENGRLQTVHGDEVTSQQFASELGSGIDVAICSDEKRFVLVVLAGGALCSCRTIYPDRAAIDDSCAQL